ncbi:uncharacterized protein IUM83_01120 [Phytophthora cinnamomi]|uniref:uncharacterized protein n=1 Tax=Phytophthora cinnamomi TaxID=4785 RepID=UPI00355A1ADC|nr:hypothetical protein IUM83_01120 [Phytophthora cinnamomi]
MLGAKTAAFAAATALAVAQTRAESAAHLRVRVHAKVSCPSGQESIGVTIGVVGWDHDGCIDSDNVCVAQVSNGDCPEGAYCSKLDTGVYGCVASSKH